MQGGSCITRIALGLDCSPVSIQVAGPLLIVCPCSLEESGQKVHTFPMLAAHSCECDYSMQIKAYLKLSVY